MPQIKVTFKPKQLTRVLLSPISDRARDVVEKRFGLRPEYERMTLEAIGSSYGITRERVRQIENFALAAIRRSGSYAQAASALEELATAMREHGDLVHEANFLDRVADDGFTKNHVNFYLVLGEQFTRFKENDQYHHRWTTNAELSHAIEDALESLEKGLVPEDVLSHDEMIARFRKLLDAEIDMPVDDERAASWMELSKRIGRNPLGGWGISSSPNIRIRGMRDMAYLIIRENGSPMHFREVAQAIEQSFDRKAHEATCHNELIKDKRFVLVGRGLYALASWGYARGTVRDVVSSLLEREGALTKEDIVAKVLKERYVKENTIAVNLQNSSFFKKDDQGRYRLA